MRGLRKGGGSLLRQIKRSNSGASNTTITSMIPLSCCRFATQSSLNVSASPQSFSSQRAASLLVDPSNVTNDAIFVGASRHIPNSPRKAHEDFLKNRWPQACFLDLKEVVKEHELGLKHTMIPDPGAFTKLCGEYPWCTPVPLVVASPSLTHLAVL